MAKKVILTDDIESGDVEADAGTIEFTWGGVAMEIDLSTKNATKFSNQMAPWVAAARRAEGSPARKSSYSGKKPGTGSGYSSDQLNAMREWARRNGYTVSDKGRVPNEIVTAFELAQTAEEPTGKTPARKAPAKSAEPAFSG